jgi:hypothetical protein
MLFFFVVQAIFISKLAPGGTAELDKRLRVGDKVLSVSHGTSGISSSIVT